MHLVVFDIDGTLTETMDVDAACFTTALTDLFGFKEIDTDWSHYTHTTDSCIFCEIFEARMERHPSSEEVHTFRQHFLSLLATAAASSPFKAITGAPGLLESMLTHGQYYPALATGAWRDSARLKMSSAGMCYDHFVAASADDAPDRETIMKLSIQRATERANRRHPSRVTYVGDAVWDARACRRLGIPFVGIGSGDRAQRLLSEGALQVFPDFSKTTEFLNCLNREPQDI